MKTRTRIVIERGARALALGALGALIALWWTDRVGFDDGLRSGREAHTVVQAGVDGADLVAAPSALEQAEPNDRHAQMPGLETAVADRAGTAEDAGIVEPGETQSAATQDTSFDPTAPGASASAAAAVVQLGVRPGWVTGVVHYEGASTKREPKRIDHWSDPSCVMRANATDEKLILSRGRVANVVVYTPSKRRARPGSKIGDEDYDTVMGRRLPIVSVRQERCRFEPHVAVVQPKQRLRFENGDLTSFDVSGERDGVTLFSYEVDPGRSSPEVTFDAPGIIRLRSEKHPWMEAWVFVTRDDVTVTGADGAFSMKLDDGTRELSAWHEFLGVKRVTVDVKQGTASTVISYDDDDVALWQGKRPAGREARRAAP